MMYHHSHRIAIESIMGLSTGHKADSADHVADVHCGTFAHATLPRQLLLFPSTAKWRFRAASGQPLGWVRPPSLSGQLLALLVAAVSLPWYVLSCYCSNCALSFLGA
jgi:hypothetical protein